MRINKIGAKVKTVSFSFIQGKFFFLYCYIVFERKNLISKYSFVGVISVHSAKYGHYIRYIN